MTAVRSFLDGLRRVATAPMLLLGVYGLTLAAALPMGFVLHESITTHLGASTVAASLAEGFDAGWWGEYQQAARGIGQTLVPEVIGFAAVLSNVSTVADGELPSGAVAGLAVVYLAAWAFLAGGIIDRLARQRRVASAGFFAACGVYFWRFARLAVLVGAVYWLLFAVVHPWLFGDLYTAMTRDATVERSAAVVRFSLYGLFGLLLLAVTLVFDYAKIRAVVEDRRSMIGAVVASLRFVRRRPAAVIGLYVLNVLLFAAVLVAYAGSAPGAGTTGAAVWLGFAVGQAYVAARLFTKLVFYASQTAYFQRELAHARYVARPQPQWPASPMAEAIGAPPPES